MPAIMNQGKNKNILVSIVIFVRPLENDKFSIWMQRRQEEGILKNLWEFPGGKIEFNESPKAAAKREVLEEVGVDIDHFPSETGHEQKLELFKLVSYQGHNLRNILLYVYIYIMNDNFSVLPENENLDLQKWHEIHYETGSTPFKGQIPQINHLIIDELSIYLKKQLIGMEK